MTTKSDCYRVMSAANQDTSGREESRHLTHAAALGVGRKLAKAGGCVWIEYVHAAGSLAAHDSEDYERMETLSKGV